MSIRRNTTNVPFPKTNINLWKAKRGEEEVVLPEYLSLPFFPGKPITPETDYLSKTDFFDDHKSVISLHDEEDDAQWLDSDQDEDQNGGNNQNVQLLVNDQGDDPWLDDGMDEVLRTMKDPARNKKRKREDEISTAKDTKVMKNSSNKKGPSKVYEKYAFGRQSEM
ncbi:hypothetical protein HDE_02722 [Halotydeus destructor]|nr:hypothetical protein HDE_02722 [Halotydeus destructor]